MLKKPVTPRPSSSHSTDEDIQGSKDALIQDLEKKLRTKEARRRISQVDFLLLNTFTVDDDDVMVLVVIKVSLPTEIVI